MSEYHSRLDDKGNLHYRSWKRGEGETSGVKEDVDIKELREYREWYGDKWRDTSVEDKKVAKKTETT